MNEIDRIIHLPVRLKYSLNSPLKDALNVAVAKARLEQEVAGMVQAIAQAYKRWSDFVQGIVDSDVAQAQSAFVRTLAIAIPDLFVVACDQQAFGDYALDENEQKVLESSREDLSAKLALAEISARLGVDTRKAITRILKESPLLNDEKEAAAKRSGYLRNL
jgi:hypothetical protein